MALRSMTGFGRAEGVVGGRALSLEVRAVNHRYLDVRVRLPSELLSQVGRVEAVAKESLGRGRVEVTGRLAASGGGALIDRDRARAVLAELVVLRDELAPGTEVPLSLLSAVPDLFAPTPTLDADEASAALEAAMRGACRELEAMRAREGEALARDMAERVATLRTTVDEIDERRDALVQAQRERLRLRLERLLADTGARVDEGRLEQEIAILADRADVVEELTRLRSHLEQFDAIVAQADAQVGRKLDFLVQEMNREVNTIGSKAADAALSHQVVAMKSEIERIREQVQNVL